MNGDGDGDDLELVLPVSLFRAKTPDGEKDFIVVATAQDGFARGLPAEAIVGVLREPFDPAIGIRPEQLIAGGVFLDLLHEVIRRDGRSLPGPRAEAARLGTGYVYVIDRRTATPEGAVPPADILGAFEVADSQVGAYQPNPNYRLLTERGFPQLAELLPLVLEELARRQAD